MKIDNRNPLISQPSAAPEPKPEPPVAKAGAPSVDDRFVPPGEKPYAYSKIESPQPGLRNAALDQALSEALADGSVTTVEWNTLIKPAADALPLQASADARKLAAVYTDTDVQLESGAASEVVKFLISRGYDAKGTRQTGEAALHKLVSSNVSEVDATFADLVARAGKQGAEVTVGVLDSGFDSTHVAFKDKLWVNQGEIAGDGIDNDNNGFADDINGADFVDRDGNQNNGSESSGHATHVTGIATRGTDQVNAMLLRGFASSLDPKDIADAIDYAAANGARVINMSFKVRTPEAVELLKAAMARHPDVLFVKSAGNDNRDLNSYDALAYLPTNEIPNMIVSSAATKDGKKASYSNYGLPWSTHAAVGDVLSTLPGNRFVEYGGTSMSSPNTTAAAGKMLVLDPGLKPADLMGMLEDTGTPSETWETLTRSGGLIHEERAYKLAGLTGLVRENPSMTGDQAADQLGLAGDERAQLLALLPKYLPAQSARVA
ncbi:MAG: S8 family serine peptidase [Myxococcota bacterium]|nr:S8 family serine peptidase [Myxococcota bacterium]